MKNQLTPDKLDALYYFQFQPHVLPMNEYNFFIIINSTKNILLLYGIEYFFKCADEKLYRSHSFQYFISLLPALHLCNNKVIRSKRKYITTISRFILQESYLYPSFCLCNSLKHCISTPNRPRTKRHEAFGSSFLPFTFRLNSPGQEYRNNESF